MQLCKKKIDRNRVITNNFVFILVILYSLPSTFIIHAPTALIFYWRELLIEFFFEKFNQWLSLHGLNRGNGDRLFDGPIFHSGGDVGRWPSFPLRYAARREMLTRSRLDSTE